MKEIRLHGRGGQGVVKAAQTIVSTVVDDGSYGQFIPFFGVERKGSPVYGYLRLDDKDIRIKTQVYTPEVLLILDDTLLDMPQTFAGVQKGGIVVLNTSKSIDELNIPEQVETIALLNAEPIALKHIKRNIPNTSMLGAFAKATGLVNWEMLKSHIAAAFGEANSVAAAEAYDTVEIIHRGGKA